MEDREAAIAAIRKCETRESLDRILNLFKIKGEQETIDLLNECMYSPTTFFSSEGMTKEVELDFTKQIFLTGGWRLNEYYDKLGIERVKANA